jgi:hypothetical protein
VNAFFEEENGFVHNKDADACLRFLWLQKPTFTSRMLTQLQNFDPVDQYLKISHLCFKKQLNHI